MAVNEALEDLYFLYVDRKFTRGNLKMMIEDGNAALRVMTRQGLTLAEDDGRVPRAPTEEEETAHVDDDFNGR